VYNGQCEIEGKLLMGQERECTICKHYGLPTAASEILERTKLFDEEGAPAVIDLCVKHSVDLFKIGQRRFLLEHYKILVDLIASDEPKFLEILEKTIKKYPNQIV